ncbi:cell division protein FtsQ [Donghicola sp. C2-DW-16]|uniref:Cell division protein FtsQ n=1 Tax=Donghicola mangrovi TaxID=2729614 RepID=A0A850QC65_9RHOB|nr:cell division protein FtsQ/DivIB [Donghicola mangrovi]NVO23491.1 cell division protein FtsQ [Donghicola mangrovi]NVO27051.1 cell division protein FtsQ [Donghicola mangrovi]
MTRRADPAPSRWAYKVQRLWLTPVFRTGLRTGLPVLVVALVAGIYLGNEQRRADLFAGIEGIKRDFQERPEFMVQMMSVDGANEKTLKAIHELMPANFPLSSFDLNLGELRDKIRGIDAVKDVTLQIRSGGVLQVNVTERIPVALWRGPEGVEVIDAEGVRADKLGTRIERPDLPLIVGEGAKQNVPEALELIAAAAPLKERVRGIVRVSNRRWDLVLDRDQRILLPEDDAIRALERVIALEQAKELLTRDVAVVDMRLADRPTIRMTETAHKELLRVRGVKIED